MAATPVASEDVCRPDILGRIASFLQPNEVACTLRLVSRSTAEQFRGQAVVRLSQPSPTAAFAAHWSAPGGCRALSYKRRLQVVCLTAASGNVGNLVVALAAAGLCPSVEVMAAAAAAGRLHVCRWLAERGCPLEGLSLSAGGMILDTPLMAAAKGGHVEICDWLLEQGCAWEPQCVTSAARGSHLELMRAFLRKAPPGPSGLVPKGDLLIAAAEGCDLGTLQELWREWGGGDQSVLYHAVIGAARSPTFDWAPKVAWLLLEQGAERHTGVCWAAAACPDGVARLTLLVEGMGFPVDASAVDSAAENGRVNSVNWLLARGLRPTKGNPLRTAIERGHAEALRALHSAGWRLPNANELVRQACWSGSMEMVNWELEACGPEALHAAGYETSTAALRSGSLELVMLVLEEGLGPGEAPLFHAAEGGCVEVLDLLAECGLDMQAAFHSHNHPYLMAAGRGDLLTLGALRRLGVPLGRTRQESRALLARAISEKHAPLPALRWLREAVGEVDWAAAAEEAESAHGLERWRAEVRAWVDAEAAEADARGGGRQGRR